MRHHRTILPMDFEIHTQSCVSVNKSITFTRCLSGENSSMTDVFSATLGSPHKMKTYDGGGGGGA